MQLAFELLFISQARDLQYRIRPAQAKYNRSAQSDAFTCPAHSKTCLQYIDSGGPHSADAFVASHKSEKACNNTPRQGPRRMSVEMSRARCKITPRSTRCGRCRGKGKPLVKETLFSQSIVEGNLEQPIGRLAVSAALSLQPRSSMVEISYL